MKSRLVTTLLFVLFLAQDASLQTGKGASTITEASVRGHMEFLASDAMKGRGSGTEDEWRAATYIGAQMRRWGLEPLGDKGGFVKQIQTTRTQVIAPPTLTIRNAKFTHGREILVQAFGRGSMTGTIVTYKAGTPAPAGTFVLVPEGVTPEAADVATANAILTVETPQQRAGWDAAASVMPGAGGGRRGGGPPNQARIVVSKAAFELWANLAGDGAPVTFQVETKPGYTWNALGKLTGSDARLAAEAILLSAHLDHIGVGGQGPDTIRNGADDDASGTIAVLELAEAISKGPRPKRTIIFALFGSEETGGAGSGDFVANPPMPLTQLVAQLQFEMIANRDPKVPEQTLWLTGYDCSNLGADLAKQGARLVADPHPTQSFFTRSDNFRFARAGVVAHTVSSFDAVGSKTYHQASDEISTVDFAHMTRSIQSMLAPVVWLANSTYKPTWHEGKDPSKGGSCGARQG